MSEYNFKFYQIGGSVRDQLLGLEVKDHDFTVVYESDQEVTEQTTDLAFNRLQDHLKSEGYELFLITRDCLTIRARFPMNHKHKGMIADFVLARHELGYHKGTRRPIVIPGTLWQDQARRDFICNTIAIDEKNNIIDPFGGQEDIKNKILRTPLDPELTFNDDALRILRSIRFSLTKGFRMCNDILEVIHTFDYMTKFSVISEERIREELYKCFKHDTHATLALLASFPILEFYIFTKTNLWLMPTLKEK